MCHVAAPDISTVPLWSGRRCIVSPPVRGGMQQAVLPPARSGIQHGVLYVGYVLGAGSIKDPHEIEGAGHRPDSAAHPGHMFGRPPRASAVFSRSPCAIFHKCDPRSWPARTRFVSSTCVRTSLRNISQPMQLRSRDQVELAALRESQALEIDSAIVTTTDMQVANE